MPNPDYQPYVHAGNGRMYSSQEAHNLSRAVEMYERVLMRWDASLVEEFIAPGYVQHSALAADGVKPLKDFLTMAAREWPEARFRIARVIVDGDFVAMHLWGALRPDEPGSAIVDIFRMADGMIVEHWDVIQQIPAKLAHANGIV